MSVAGHPDDDCDKEAGTNGVNDSQKERNVKNISIILLYGTKIKGEASF